MSKIFEQRKHSLKSPPNVPNIGIEANTRQKLYVSIGNYDSPVLSVPNLSPHQRNESYNSNFQAMVTTNMSLEILVVNDQFAIWLKHFATELCGKRISECFVNPREVTDVLDQQSALDLIVTGSIVSK